MLTLVKLQNFKNYRDATINLQKFNLIVGANSAGKSNFIQALKFVRDIAEHGLENAVSMQGGIDFLKNVNVPNSNRVVVELHFDLQSNMTNLTGLIKNLVGLQYNIQLKQVSQFDFQVISEQVTLLFEHQGATDAISIANNGLLLKAQHAEKFAIESVQGVLQLVTMLLQQKNEVVHNKYSLLHDLAILLPPGLFKYPVFDFNSKQLKQESSVVGKVELNEDGANLVLVLKKILEVDDTRRTFFNLLHDLLPFVEDVGIKAVADKFLSIQIRELYHKGYIPASLLSDGTMKVIAMLIATVFDKRNVIILEEPERNLHPSLISRLVEFFYDSVGPRQLIVTTHNPEVVKQANINDLFLVSRNAKGDSFIQKPAEKEQVKLFLANEMGLDELFVQNLLGV